MWRDEHWNIHRLLLWPQTDVWFPRSSFKLSWGTRSKHHQPLRNMSFKYYTEIRGPTMHHVLHSTKKDLQLQSCDIILLISINELQISPAELWNFSYWTSSRDGKQTTTRNQWALKIMGEINGDIQHQETSSPIMALMNIFFWVWSQHRAAAENCFKSIMRFVSLTTGK